MSSTGSKSQMTKGSKTPGANKTPGGNKTPGAGQQKISAFFTQRVPASADKAASTPQPCATPVVKQAGQQEEVPQSTRPSTTTKPSPPQAPPQPVGTRIRVFWPDDDTWYKGTVKGYNADNGKSQVKYDDGDVEWVALASEKYEVLPAADSKAKPVAAKSKPAAQEQADELEDEDVDISDMPPAASPGAAATGAGRRRLVRGGAAASKANTTKGKAGSKKTAMLSDEDDSSADSGSEFEPEGSESEDGGDAELDVEVSSEGGVSEDLDDEMSPNGSKEAAGAGSKRKAAPGKARGQATKKAATTSTKAAPLSTPAPSSRAAASAASTPATRTPSHAFTPQSGAASRLASALAVTPATASKTDVVKEVVHGVATRLSNEDSGRFLGRMAERFKFLHPSVIMDAERRKPSHPDYDPSTVYIPPSWFKDNKVSEGQQQWWNFKAANFDSVLLFKMGKFYEMFEMDAYVGVDVLGLSFMKGDQPHAGFPEIRYHDMAEALARAGYKVVVVEQTETPDQLAKRNEERKAQKLKMANVVNREKVAVLSKGTLIDAEMVASKPDPSYVMAVVELPAPEGRTDLTLVTRLGVAAVDVASGHMVLGEFLDDEVRSSLRTHLTALQPVELVLPPRTASTPAAGPGRAAGGIGGSAGQEAGTYVEGITLRVLKTALRDPRLNITRKGAWSAGKAVKLIQERRYFKAPLATEAGQAPATTTPKPSSAGFDGWPPALQSIAQAWTSGKPCPGTAAAAAATAEMEVDVQGSEAVQGCEGAAALAALCGLIDFLKDALLDLAVLPQGRLEALPALTRATGKPGDASSHSGGVTPLGSDEPVHMLLNGAALENLEVLENTEGGSNGSLLSVLDHCVTPFGRRRLRQWLCRPLYRPADIIRRQDAVAALMAASADELGCVRKQLGRVSDLERSVARLFSSTVEGAAGRDAGHVVLYEDAAKRKVKALTAAFKDLQTVAKAAQQLRTALDGGDEAGEAGAMLQELTRVDKWEQVESCLGVLDAAADWKQAEVTGRVVPAEGVNAAYDAALAAVSSAEADLANYLVDLRGQVSGASARDITYISMNKDSHVLEVPEGAKVPSSFTLKGQRKGFKRWTTNKLQGLTAALEGAQAGKEVALASILQALVVQFCNERKLWSWAVDAVADLDALMSLASHALNADGAVCRPTILPTTEGAPLLEAQGLRHPAGLPGRCGAFVPNDVQLGGGEAPAFIVLSGPNMGGKSTMLRQVCLAAVLAQVGACVPAESLRLTPVDAVFVRMGAKDHIMTGQSTFFVEMAETAAMLHKATSRSLVALDELGRGTATLDGAAIASAVLQHMAGRVGCRGLFATHYHHLSKEHASDPAIAIMHMACAVGSAQEEEDGEQGAAAMQVDGSGQAGQEEEEVKEVTFLYKLTPGACPKSYGTNVARLAGLPAATVQRAASMSAATEGHIAEAVACLKQAAGDNGMDVDGAGGGDASAAEVLAAAQEALVVLRAAAQQGQVSGDVLQSWEKAQTRACAILSASA